MKKKSKIRLMTILIIMAAGLLFSCPPPGSSGNKVTLTRIDLNLNLVVGVVGDFIIELRDDAGSSPAIWSATIDASTLPAGTNWDSLSVPNISLTKGQTYRIYATYSGGINQITWMSSDPVDDEYTPGVCSTGNADQDFNFKTYNDGVLDQQMITVESGWSLSNGDFFWWQEFVPGD
jgi:hypothetical protein